MVPQMQPLWKRPYFLHAGNIRMSCLQSHLKATEKRSPWLYYWNGWSSESPSTLQNRSQTTFARLRMAPTFSGKWARYVDSFRGERTPELRALDGAFGRV